MSLLTESPQTGIITQDPVLLGKVQSLYEDLSQKSYTKVVKNGWCYEVARKLEGLGLRYVEGYFWADNYYGQPGAHSVEHAWAEDPNRTIVELTGMQFNSYLHKTFPEGVVLITPNDPNWPRYVKSYKYQALGLIRSLSNRIRPSFYSPIV